jgi:hypothetical protein
MALRHIWTQWRRLPFDHEEADPWGTWLDPLALGKAEIPFMTEYRYLGAPLKQFLDLTEYATNKAIALGASYRCWFQSHPLLKGLGSRAKIKIANTLCLGPIN